MHLGLNPPEGGSRPAGYPLRLEAPVVVAAKGLRDVRLALALLARCAMSR
jgi:hypothetical protein